MNLLHAIILGVVEGITEFLPVSSTGHLRIVEKLLGYDIQGAGITAFTAIIQVGAILAAIIYFWKDIVRIVAAWFRGLTGENGRADPDYTLGWGIIVGSIPVAVVGLLCKDLIEGALSSLWVIAAALLLWSIAMAVADRRRDLTRRMGDVGIKDALIIGLFQALAPLFPGISRSGATISAGLFRGYTRETATRLSFYMGIPALVAAGAYEAATAASDITSAPAGSTAIGWAPTIVATLVSLIVAYFSIAWLLKFVSSNKFTGFVVYRVVLAAVIIVLLVLGVVRA
ncbi:undecaprenyl-diphosphate phosphatase [uncultured Propionibacterium sp.]|uniref:undecaprenyl-diphosphate phosphatase n=1 Tax=uncultured Propionibacterium sp. TaxID=218066 RepID=UPI00292ED01D|nr:undecaprenyl-diphosphate phosphatase [uncultured Propionibacterium sp.]